MKSIKKIWFVTAICMLAAAAFCLTGCGKSSGGASRSTYTIAATVDTEHATVAATCDICYVNRAPVELDEAWFHLYPAAYREGARYTPIAAADEASAYPHGISYGGIAVTNVTGGEYEIGGRDDDILIVKLPKTLLPGESARIAVEYTLTLPEMRHRFGYIDGIVNLGNWYPIECVYDGGFDDDPYYADGDPFHLPVCDYSVSITAPSDLTVAMPAASERTESEQSAVTRCTLKKARDFAAVLGKFETVSGKCDGVDVTYYYTADEAAQAHLQAACDALSYFSSAFGAYPYKTYSVVQTPFNQGGMEYSALVYISDAVQGNMITEVIVHETAHQWWYGIVGNDQVKDAWLDEALAEYSTTLFYRNRPDYGVKYDDRIADAMGGFSLYCELSRCDDTSMNRSLGDYASGAEYTYMTYVKGQLMYDSLLVMLGEKTLVAGLRRYADKYAFSFATPDGLIGCLESASHRELKPFMDSFILGTAKLYGGV